MQMIVPDDRQQTLVLSKQYSTVLVSVAFLFAAFQLQLANLVQPAVAKIV